MSGKQISVLVRRVIGADRQRWFSLVFSIALGIASVLSVEGTLHAVRSQLGGEARKSMGADLILSSWRPLDDSFSQALSETFKAREGSSMTRSVEMASMAQLIFDAEVEETKREASPRLIALKGVEEAYPLYGELRISPLSKESLEPLPSRAMKISELGAQEVWIASSLFQQWKGEKQAGHDGSVLQIKIGDMTFTVNGLIDSEPDQGLSGTLSFAPRVMMRRDDLDQLGLIRFGSRVRHKLLFSVGQLSSGEREGEFLEMIQKARLDAPPYIQIQSYLTSQPMIVQLFERIGLFFTIVGLISLCLCILSFYSAMLGLLSDQLPITALARLLGVSSDAISRAYSILFGIVGLAGGFLGWLISLVVQWGLNLVMSKHLDTSLTLSLSSDILGGALLMGSVMGLCVNGLIQRSQLSTEGHILWSERAEGVLTTTLAKVCGAGLTLISVGTYLWISSGSLFLTAFFLIGLCAMTLLVSIFILVQFRFLRILLRLGHSWSWPRGLLFAVRQLLGYERRTWVALLSLGVSLSLIGSLFLVSQSFDQALRLDDEQAPQLFMIDIQDDQRELVLNSFAQLGFPSPQLRPLIRARIASLKGQAVRRSAEEDHTPAGRMRDQSLTREYNLTTQISLSETEEVVEGRWWTGEEAKDPTKQYVSVEYRHAKSLGLQRGDLITFDIQGRHLSFTILNLRRVDWLSFNPNFLYVLSPAPLEGAPLTWISGARLPDEQSWKILNQSLFRSAPNISLIDLRPILERGLALVNSLTQALWLTGFVCILAGFLLVISDLRRDHLRRQTAVHLLSDLGISRRSAWRWMTLELGILGALSALSVCLGIILSGWGITQLLLIPLVDPVPHLLMWALLCLALPLGVGSLVRWTKREEMR